MADTPENEILSQEELDALMESAQPAASSESTETEAPAQAEVELAQPTDESEPIDYEMPESEPMAAALKMETFSERSVKPVSALQSFERIEDVPLDLTVELGRTKLLIKDVLDLGAGSIVELEKMAGEPVDLLANGLLIARGEVVVIDDNFGVRITEVITSAERKALTEESADLHAA